MIKFPTKFYTMSGDDGGSSGSSTSDKKYEITITQPSEHEPRPDFIRGIPYDAKDNVMYCKHRKMTLDDMKEINPDATEEPANMYILQDINGKDLIIASDMIESIAKMQLFIVIEYSGKSTYNYIPLTGYALKQNFNGKSFAMLAYSKSNSTYLVKISDVDIWMAVGS